ncbi:hypothetical protein GCM10028796_24820 [Ramlibacter monticola]|uniref:Uncharacterized protein n=1 Tax=Ramlibacter monticola TaxID=1926872 RepID=A0A936Z1Q7_9BURK|nr:hypothetical protein [Ramlibacter monticola]MBL0392727.1 hypothetical protein [Ramlibacter monticola]
MNRKERHEVPAPTGGNTVTAQGETSQPKAQTPNEVDESSHSQAADNPGARRKGEIAHDDAMKGLQDTTKGKELDATYQRVRKEGSR